MSITGIFSESFWYIAPIIAAMTVTITGAINGKFNINKGIWPQLVSWIVASILSVCAWQFNFVTLGEPTWVSAIALCAVTGLSSNGVYDIPTIKALIKRLFNEVTTVKNKS